MSVFMERNTGLCALLVVAMGPRSPRRRSICSASRSRAGGLLAPGYVIVNIILMSPWRITSPIAIIAATPLARMRPRAAIALRGVAPYKARGADARSRALLLSLAFQRS